MSRMDEDEEELTEEQVSALLDKLLGEAVEAAQAEAAAEAADSVGPKRADKISTPLRRTAPPTVGRPRRNKPS